MHRELASGLSMPVGFKNSTDGSTQTAVDAVLTARSPHWFPSVTKQGVSAIFQTDRQRHLPRDPARRHADRARTTTPSTSPRSARGSRPQGLRETRDDRLLARQQPEGSSAAGGRRRVDLPSRSPPGSWQIFGAMLESHLVEGRQDYVPGPSRGLRPEHHRRLPLARADRAAARAARAGAAGTRGRTGGVTGQQATSRRLAIVHFRRLTTHPFTFPHGRARTSVTRTRQKRLDTPACRRRCERA